MCTTFDRSSMKKDFIADTTAAIDYLFLSISIQLCGYDQIIGLGHAVLSWSCKYMFFSPRGLFREQNNVGKLQVASNM